MPSHYTAYLYPLTLKKVQCGENKDDFLANFTNAFSALRFLKKKSCKLLKINQCLTHQQNLLLKHFFFLQRRQ